MEAYLPKESENTVLNKTVLRSVWSNKVIVGALGVRNEKEAREWFMRHPHVHEEFEKMNCELQEKILELQKRAHNGLQQILVNERRPDINFDAVDVNMNINMKRVKRE
jgi:hypothetical protein